MSANLIRKISGSIPPTVWGWLANLYPPFWACGIFVRHISRDFSTIDVRLYSYGLNLNYVGTHFGGSLSAMADPWFMIILIQRLGKEFIVWDKGARIEFKRPGRGTLRATFHFSDEEIQAVREKALAQEKYIFEKQVEIKNNHGEVVAVVDKVLYVRKKN